MNEPMLEARASDGDEESKRILADYKRRSKVLAQEERHKKELVFFKYKQEYLKSKGYYDNKETDQPQDEAHAGA